MNKIDWVKFANGQQQINVQGIANTENRKRLVGEAMRLITENPQTALQEEFLGFKNYDAFGDQRCDCEYGYGPRHGSIVFSIGRSSDWRDKALTEDAVYFLRCFRDAVGRNKQDDKYHPTIENISQVFSRMRELEKESGDLQEWLDVLLVDEKDEEKVKL